MQSILFKEYLDEIIVKLKVVELTSLLESILFAKQNQQIEEAKKVNFSKLIFESKEGFYSCSTDESKKKVLYSFEFDKIYESSKLSKLITIFNNSAHPSDIYGNSGNLPMFSNFYYSLYNIKIIQNSVTELLFKEKLSEITEDESIFELQIYDFDNTGIDISQLHKVLTSISILIENISRLLNVQTITSKISYIDSGSDFLLAIKGVKSVIEMIKLIYNEYWLKVRFSTFDKFDRKVESLSKGLKLVELINEQVKKGVIDEESGKIILHQITSEMTTLIGYGALPKDCDKHDSINNRQLLEDKKDIKLLNSGTK